MTIQEALERAKLMRRAREAGVDADEHTTRRPIDDTASLAVLHEGVRTPSEPISYADFERVEFDATACERNRVLVSEQPANEAQRRAATAYRLLRSRTQHRLKGNNWKCIGLTSPGPGEGKTITALNVAISIAREKQRMVYLLDLDMRSPSVLEYLGVQPPLPLSAFFDAGAGAEQILFATPVEGLVVAGNRQAVAAASELLASSRLEELLDYIRRRSPDALILIDLPPVMSTDEALVVAPRVDGLFLVVSEGVTRRDALMRSVNLLSDFPVAGVILNRSTEQLGGDYYTY